MSLADSSRRHFAVLLAVYLVAYLGRSFMAFFTGEGDGVAACLPAWLAGWLPSAMRVATCEEWRCGARSRLLLSCSSPPHSLPLSQALASSWPSRW